MPPAPEEVGAGAARVANFRPILGSSWQRDSTEEGLVLLDFELDDHELHDLELPELRE